MQAALTNVLSVAASFGVLTACFQWGWGLGIVGIDPYSGDSSPIASYVPLMMFAILFGLSMDYQVFLLSTIDALRAQGSERPARRSTLGLARSARVIAAAALIMIAVFGSFILNGDPIVKQFGVGLAVAVATRRDHDAPPRAGGPRARGSRRVVGPALARPLPARSRHRGTARRESDAPRGPQRPERGGSPDRST